MMALTDADKRWLTDELKNGFAEHVLKQHVAACPHGKRLAVFRARLIGMAMGVGAVVGGGGVALGKFLL